MYLFFSLLLILIIAAVFWVTAIFRLPLTKTKIKIKDKEFIVWVAKTHKEHQQGLQNIIFLPSNRGMLFSFESPDSYCFWNKNTLIGLKLIFMRKDKIINEAYLKPVWQGEQTICPNEPVDAVIEISAR